MIAVDVEKHKKS